MSKKDTYGKGPTHGYEAAGYSAAYDAERAEARKELDACTAGPKDQPAIAPNDAEMKDPDGEFQRPAPMTGAQPAGASPERPGPNGAGNSKGDGTIDPQGQQGGTAGGQPPLPATRGEGTPLASGEERDRRSVQRGGPGADKPV